MITWMINVNNFQIAKVQSQCAAYHLLDFLPVSAWRSYESVPIKRSMYPGVSGKYFFRVMWLLKSLFGLCKFSVIKKTERYS